MISPKTPKETKSYFIKDIFTKVIIPDKDLDKPPVSGWSRFLRVAWFVVPIIIFTALVTWITVSYYQDKKLLANVQKAETDVVNIDRKSLAMEILRNLDKLDQQRTKLKGFNLFLWGDDRKKVDDHSIETYNSAKARYITEINVKLLPGAVVSVVYTENGKRRVVSTVSTDKVGVAAGVEVANSPGDQELIIKLDKQEYTITFQISEGNDHKYVVIIKENGGLSKQVGKVEGGIDREGPYIKIVFDGY
jgi:hypothetical protein